MRLIQRHSSMCRASPRAPCGSRRTPSWSAPVVEARSPRLQPAAEVRGPVEGALDEEGRLVRGDQGRLQQIVSNLPVQCDQKFTPSGVASTSASARRGSAVEIIVRDTGKGITAEQLRGSSPQFGTANVSSQAQGVWGSASAIVRHLVELHGGEVQVPARARAGRRPSTVEPPAHGRTSRWRGGGPRGIAAQRT